MSLFSFSFSSFVVLTFDLVSDCPRFFPLLYATIGLVGKRSLSVVLFSVISQCFLITSLIRCDPGCNDVEKTGLHGEVFLLVSLRYSRLLS